MTMTPQAKGQLSKTIRELRARLLADLEGALQGAYRLGIGAEQAKLPAAAAMKRARLDAWVDEQVSALPKTKAGKEIGKVALQDAVARFRGEVVKTAAYTLLNRLVYVRLLEAAGLRPMAVVTGGRSSRGYQDFRDLAPELTHDESEGYAFLLQLVFEELAVDLPGLFGSAGLAELVPVPASTLQAVIDALDEGELSSCWTDDMTL
ncbi:MAG: SAM-dependent methyltransferase, partial [Nannocystaceae bacterium]